MIRRTSNKICFPWLLRSTTTLFALLIFTAVVTRFALFITDPVCVQGSAYTSKREVEQHVLVCQLTLFPEVRMPRSDKKDNSHHNYKQNSLYGAFCLRYRFMFAASSRNESMAKNSTNI